MIIEKLDDTIPRDDDLAPGVPGNKSAEEQREVRRKINTMIEVINYLLDR